MIKKQMQGGDPSYRTSSGQHLLAAAEASEPLSLQGSTRGTLDLLEDEANPVGAVTAMLTNPIWVVKTRVFATGKNDPKAFKGLWGEPKPVNVHRVVGAWPGC